MNSRADGFLNMGVEGDIKWTKYHSLNHIGFIQMTKGTN